MKYWIDKLDAWIFDSYACPSENLSIYRLTYSVWLLLIIGPPRFAERMRYFPDGAYDPNPGLGQLFSTVPDLFFFQLIDGVISVALLALLVGLFTRWASVLLTLGFVLGNTFVFALGKIDHNLMTWLIPLILSFSGWGRHYSVDALLRKRGRPTYSWPITLMSVLLGFGLFTSGIIKVVGGWLSPKTAMVRAYFLRNYYNYDREGVLTDALLELQWSPFWEFQDWMTIFFEIGILVAILSPVFYRLFTLLAIFFHLMVYLILGISFTHFLIVYVLFWVPIMRFQHLRDFLDTPKNQVYLLVLLGTLGLISLLQPRASIFVYLINAVGLSGWRPFLLLLGANLVILFVLLRHPGFLFIRHYREWTPEYRPILLFDGCCVLCNRLVDFVLKYDRTKRFRFAVQQTAQGEEGAPIPLRLYLPEGGELRSSSAVLEVLRLLYSFYPLVYLGRLIPGFLRDAIYQLVARNRYRWFGRRQKCRVPDLAFEGRFIDPPEEMRK